jgi:hypothetical protein
MSVQYDSKTTVVHISKLINIYVFITILYSMPYI